MSADLPSSITIGSQIIQDPRRFFIIYKHDSGWDLAKHVHDGLHERVRDVFLDKDNLEEGLSRGEWRRQIDAAIDRTDVFIFIVTNGASNSPDIKHELQRAMEKAREDPNKKIIAFVDNDIWNEEGELTITINSTSINIKDFQVSQFNARAPMALLREVTKSAQITRIIKPQ